MDKRFDKRARRRRIAAAAALVLLAFLVDSFGVRRLSGSDFPVESELAKEERDIVNSLASPDLGGRVPGSEGNRRAAAMLEHELDARGVRPFPSMGRYTSPLVDPRLGDNVLAWLPATDGVSRSAIVLGAHFDHLGKTEDGMVLGADDNASSVAVVLGALDRLKAAPRTHPIAVAFFNTEEAPYFGTPRQGSQAFAASLPAEIGDLRRVRLAIVLDLVGGVVWRPLAHTIFACGAEKSGSLAALVDRAHEDGLDVLRVGVHMVENIPGYRPMPVSDYDVFRNHRVPFLFLSSGRTPRYHRPEDVPATLYYERMALTSAWIAKVVAEVDEVEDDFGYDASAIDLDADRRAMVWATGAALKPWSSVPGTGPLSWARLAVDRSRAGDPRSTVLDLERASFRIQCLIYGYPICFTL